MPHQRVPEILTKLYIDFLRSLSLEDASLQYDTSLASLLTGDLSDRTAVTPTASFKGGIDSFGQQYGTFRGCEITIHGTPPRHHLNPSSRRRLLREVQSTLDSLVDVFYGDVTSLDCLTDTSDTESRYSLPEAIQTLKREIEFLDNENRTLAHHLTDMTDVFQEKHDDLDRELKQAGFTTFPADNDVRSADIDLLAATIESSLIKLSLTSARSERAVYHHRPSQESGSVAQALSVAYLELKKEEAKMKNESNVLDRQLQEYETMLLLVDGGSGGYQQVINDWTEVKQETEECLRDLRRLGWIGDYYLTSL